MTEGTEETEKGREKGKGSEGIPIYIVIFEDAFPDLGILQKIQNCFREIVVFK